jgi:hypothetical protein
MLLLAVAAILLAYLLNRSLSAFHVQAPWWLDTPSVLGFYGLCWRFYDGFLWRFGLRSFTLSGIPDLTGEWTGTIVSSYKAQEPVNASLVVRQTSSRLLVTLATKTSTSHSTMAALYSQPGPASGLRYEFSNVPHSLSVQTMVPHSGLAHLMLSVDGSRLTGDYQTDRFRKTNGRLDFQRVTAGRAWEKQLGVLGANFR